ncbi:flagellar hook-associated protein K [marine gamma proteobacterium HTCC2143]|uniref:Flagellar hook-associated protein 1 n=1 Tax=marine gamma proteobacterium HTCC2143 TaxID=247633 RepID=A0YG76_9GAMM|nr:flagellar hook-associated protein K [marine gamma proteobacterium HTCC2143]
MSLLNVGISALTTNQKLLQVTGNNISNAGVESYSRQRAEVSTRPEQLLGGSYQGTGNTVDNISRVVDQFLITQIQLDTSSRSSLEAFARNMEQVDGLLSDDFSGLSAILSEFFAAIESSAQDPTSEPARQVVITQAESLALKINNLSDRVEQQLNFVDGQLRALSSQATTLAKGIASLNEGIADQVARGGGAQPNQLLDQRDEMLRQLAEIVNISTVKDGNDLNVFIGNGLPLVTGFKALALDTQQGVDGVNIMLVGRGSVSQRVTHLMSGGEMGGLLDFREVGGDLLNVIGRIGIGLADSVNQQNALGIDLDGNAGGTIFRDVNAGTIPQSRIIADGDNSAPTLQNMAINITDVGQLTTSDYRLSVVDNDGAAPLDYRILRVSDNATTIVNGIAGAQSIAIDGFSIDISSATQANLALNDQFRIRPTRAGGADTTVDITRQQELAYSVPVVTDAKIGNNGTGVISSGEMLAVVDDSALALTPANPIYQSAGVLAAPVLIQFTTATDYTVYETSDPFNPAVLFSGTIIPGQKNEIFGSQGTDPNFIGFQVTIDGAPQVNDEFTIDFNQNGSSDNRNAAALSGIRAQNILDGNSTNFENSYGRLIERIGTQTAQAKVGRDASESLLFQSQASRDSMAGVNLDEEAANLIKFEQAYNASAQLITVARQIFDTLLSSLR